MEDGSAQPVSQITLEVPYRTWTDFRSAMLKVRSDHEELLGLMFCSRHDMGHHRRLLPKTWIVPGRDCYEYQSVGGLALRQDVHRYLLEEFLLPDMDIVHIHTHPGLMSPGFSSVDDRYEKAYSQGLDGLPNRPWLISGVYNEDMTLSTFRVWRSSRLWGGMLELGPQWELRQDSFHSTSFEGTLSTSQNSPMHSRQKIFGLPAQAALGQLKVGLVGCGGIGSILAEQLARLGVRNWILIDPDRLEESNLNRMPAASKSMTAARWSKVKYVRRLIQRAHDSAANVQCYRKPLGSSAADSAIVTCDIVIAATDNHDSRIVAQRLAVKHMRQFFSIGSHIDIVENTVRAMARVSAPPHDGGWCIVCAEIVNPNIAAEEQAAASINSTLREAGYLQDVEAPAVYWLNALAASAAVGLIHGAIAGFVDITSGQDWVFDFEQQHWLRLRHLNNSTCLFCSRDGYLASGPGSEARTR